MGKTHRYKYIGNKSPCGKVKFKTEEIAKEKLSIMAKLGREEIRYYFCQPCMAWHVTSRKRRILFDDEEHVDNDEQIDSQPKVASI